MSRLKILNVAWNAYGDTWARFKQQFEAIEKHHDVIYVAPMSAVNVPWIDWIHVKNIGPKRWNWRAQQEWIRDLIMNVPDFDVIYCRNGAPIRQLTDSQIAIMTQKPIVIKLGGNGREVRKHYTRYQNPFDRICEDTTDLTSLNNMDALVPLSKRLKHSFEAWILHPERVTDPVYLSVDLDKFKYYEPPGRKIYGYAGRISPEKGMNFLKKVIQATPEIEYWMAGATEGMDIVFPENVDHKGLLSMAEMPQFYSYLSAFLLPSYSEGLPNVVLEAYASGRPVFVLENTLPEELPLYGHALPHDVETWVKVLREVTLEGLRVTGIEARDWMEHNWPSWDDFGSRMSEIFIKTVENR